MYINHDMTKSNRLLGDSFRAVLAGIKDKNVNLSLRGSRVILHSNSDQNLQCSANSNLNVNNHEQVSNRMDLLVEAVDQIVVGLGL